MYLRQAWTLTRTPVSPQFCATPLALAECCVAGSCHHTLSAIWLLKSLPYHLLTEQTILESVCHILFLSCLEGTKSYFVGLTVLIFAADPLLLLPKA